MRGTDLQIAWRTPGDLTPHPANPRRHSDTQIEQLFASVSRFGWTVPIIIDEEQVILAGHGRWEMASTNNILEVPTITVAGLSEDEKRAYLIADNRLSENADWDFPQLLEELTYLSHQAIDPDTLGFSDADMLGFHSMIDDTGFPEREELPLQQPRAAVDVPVREDRITSSTDPTQVQPSFEPPGHGGDMAGPVLVPFSVMLTSDERARAFDVLGRVGGDMAEAFMRLIDEYEAGSQEPTDVE